MITLRDYQQQGLVDLHTEFDAGAHRVVFCFPTGAGKTVAAAAMIFGAIAKKKSTFFLVHRQELLHQAARTFESFGIKHGIIAPGFPRTDDQIQVVMATTLARRLDQFEPPDLLVVDEAHHSLANTWRKIFAAYPDAKAVGLTATPQRLDGQGLHELYDSLVIGPSVKDLIIQGHLSDFEVYAPPIGISTEGLHTRAGDFAQDELAKAVDKPTITGDAVATYLRLAAGKRAITYCVSIQHSKNVCAAFQARGINAAHIDGTERRDRRERIVEAFAFGEIQVLCNVDLVSEGFDVPAVEAVIQLRPTQSLVLHLQQIGRALRPGLGKTALILDHASNSLRHGLPDDQREWSLNSQKRKNNASNASISTTWLCQKCHRVVPVGAVVCPNCGFKADVKGRVVTYKDGELEKVDRVVLAKLRTQEKTGMTVREYALHRGLNENSVRYALDKGKVQREPDGSIDPVKANAFWTGNLEKNGMNAADYAAHRHISISAVRKALKTGRIQREPDGTIDPVKADADWAQNTDQSKQREPIRNQIGLGVFDYAIHRGVSETTVRKALRRGWIQKEPDGSIDPDKADAAWKIGMSPGEYAIHRNMSYDSVLSALKSGQIRRGVDGTIDPVTADAELDRSKKSNGLRVEEYAKHRGVHATTVYVALRKGRILREPDGSIDPSKADTSWGRT